MSQTTVENPVMFRIMPPVTQAMVQEEQQQRRQPRKSQSNRPSSSSSVRLWTSTHSNVVRSAPAQVLQAETQKELQPYVKTAAQRAERNARDARNLAAVSGVVIPSKVPFGQLPDQGRWEDDEKKIYPCSICARRFHDKAHVKVHMAPCVNRNGNPYGARWDDAWTKAALPATTTSVQSIKLHDLQVVDAQSDNDQIEEKQFVDYQLQEYQHGHYQNGGYKVPILPSGGSQKGHFLFEHPYKDDLLQPASPLSTGTQQSEAELLTEKPLSEDLNSSEPQPMSTAPSGLTPYDPKLRMDILTNEALITMVKAWQEIAEHGQLDHYVENPHLQKVMKEMCVRGIVDERWNWIVDPEKINLAWRRVIW